MIQWFASLTPEQQAVVVKLTMFSGLIVGAALAALIEWIRSR